MIKEVLKELGSLFGKLGGDHKERVDNMIDRDLAKEMAAEEARHCFLYRWCGRFTRESMETSLSEITQLTREAKERLVSLGYVDGKTFGIIYERKIVTSSTREAIELVAGMKDVPEPDFPGAGDEYLLSLRNQILREEKRVRAYQATTRKVFVIAAPIFVYIGFFIAWAISSPDLAVCFSAAVIWLFGKELRAGNKEVSLLFEKAGEIVGIAEKINGLTK